MVALIMNQESDEKQVGLPLCQIVPLQVSIVVKESFEVLENDDYIKSEFKYRKRAYNAGKSINDYIIWSKENYFFQPITINSYIGNVQRNYPSISLDVLKYMEQTFVKKTLAILPIANYKIGIHQIRIITKANHKGYPAPEGIHCDGCDYIGVLCINTHNIEGGVNLIYEQKNKKIIYKRKLLPGEGILFDDKEFLHYTTPIETKKPGIGYRDVFVTTFSKIDINERV